ncbi:DUF4333 domain-containing protein [Streptomyces sp. TRM70308]|uniref:DUF4333 domain-containing protein n=1 Tax=Streptomyces sp. TRM70308 TaxID=3131932 RepID=UPI003CFF6260
MRIPKIVTAVAAAALLTAGCGSDDGGSDGGGETRADAAAGAEETPTPAEPLAVEISGPQQDVVESHDDLVAPSPEPGSGAEFAEKVEYKLREKLLRQAKVNGETTADCPDGITREAGATSTCTATYEGVEIPFEVTISDRYEEGDFLIQYDTAPQQDLLVAKRVFHEFWERHQDSGGYEQMLSCDELPAAVAVDRGGDSGYQCQVWHEAGDTTTVFNVTTDSFGPEFVSAGN